MPAAKRNTTLFGAEAEAAIQTVARVRTSREALEQLSYELEHDGGMSNAAVCLRLAEIIALLRLPSQQECEAAAAEAQKRKRLTEAVQEA